MDEKTQPQSGQYVSIPEYARMLGISRIAVYNRVKKGLIPAKKIGRNYVVLLEKMPSQLIKEKTITQQHLSVAEVAKKFGISRIAVFQRIKNGQIFAIKSGRNYIIPVDADLTSVKPIRPKRALLKKVEDYISIPELAKELGVSRVEIFNRVKAGKIRAEKIGRNYVIDRQDVYSVAKPQIIKEEILSKELISIPQLAKELGVSRVSIFNKVQKGMIKARKIGRNYVIARKDVKRGLTP